MELEGWDTEWNWRGETRSGIGEVGHGVELEGWDTERKGSREQCGRVGGKGNFLVVS